MRLLLFVVLTAIYSLTGFPAAALAKPPDMVQLKVAAESGDAVAQFEYGNRGAFSKPGERIIWIRRSAEQGYAPAEEALAEDLTIRYVPDSNKKKALEREAVRWMSRAAYQGRVSAQGRLSGFYDRGFGVSRDPVVAYMWELIALHSAQREGNIFAVLAYQSARDRLIANTSTEDMVEGERRAAAFIPRRFPRMNPVEADLIFAQLRIIAFYERKDQPSVIVNNVRFSVGETKQLNLDDAAVSLTCLSISGKSANLALAGTDFQKQLTLNR